MPAELNFSFAAVILAAGRSSRMGRPKMLLPWGQTSVLGQQIELWAKISASQITVICAADDSAIQAELDRLGFPAANRIFNPEPARGMFSSIQCADQWTGWQPALTHWAIALGDQPHLKLSTLRTLVDFARQHPAKICQPAFSGHARHPVVLPASGFKSLAVSRAHSLKDFLQDNASLVELVTVDDPGLELDLDGPSDYESALKNFKG